MAYVPIDPADLYGGLLGTATAYQTLAGNHNEQYENSGTPLWDVLFAESLPDSVTDQRTWTWMLRGNRDLLTVRVRVYAESTSGTSDLILRVGGTSATTSVTSADWYTLNVTPVVAGPVVCSLSITVPGGATLTVTRMQCRLVAATPAAGTLASGYTRIDSTDIYAANGPIASEHVSRFLHGPIYIARDRPLCPALHLVRADAPTVGKTFRNWHNYNTANADVVGRLRLPRCSSRARRFVVDAFTIESGSGGTAELTIGGIELAMSAMGGTSGTWHSWELDLPPGPHDIRAAVTPGVGNAARIATMQVWRTRRSWQ